MPEAVTQAVIKLVRALQDADIGTPQRLTVDVQANGEHPYQVTFVEEDLPLPGLAIVRK